MRWWRLLAHGCWIMPGSLASILMLWLVLSDRPDLTSHVRYSQAFFDRHGSLLRLDLAADQQYRLFTRGGDIAPALVAATLLYEDRNFQHHPGVDVLALLRAFRATYVSAGRRVGGSTLTMQLARLHWRIPTHTLTGKCLQILRALQLSWHFSKQEILEHYFNLAPYGRNIVGVGAASLIYFNKTPAQLNLPEALALAVIPQNPVKRNPTSALGREHLFRARAALFERWLEDHPEHRSRRQHFELPLQFRAPEALPFEAPHFVRQVAQELGPWLPGRHLTALDQRLQQRMQDTLARYVARRAPEGIHNASALLLHAPTLEVRAMVGSARFDDERIQGQVNGVLARRSPGSALKPFVYALAFDQGLIHPLTLMQDLPRRFGGFSPENFDQRFLGPVSAREALILSRNVPAVTLANQLADPDFHQLLTRAGVRDLAAPEHYGLALVLGGAELSMMELAQLYATIPNGGMWRKASFLPARPAPADARAGRRLFSAEAAYLLLDILKDNPPPTGPTSPALHSERNHLAWKTGTSWAFRDAWALGISGPYVLAVWVGNFDGSGNPAFVGRTAAGPLMFELMQQVMPDQRWRIEQALDPADLNLKRVPVCARTGDLAEVHCPERTESWFMPGVSPVRLSHVYRQIPVAIDTGLRHCIHIPGQTQWQTFAFWPSDLAASFAQAGLALKEAPAFAEPCALDQLADLGQAPEIRSPEAELEYVRLADGAQALPLIASADADVASLYWFVDQRFVGQSTPGVALYWTMQPGSHEVLAVDDAGRSRRHRFAVITVD